MASKTRQQQIEEMLAEDPGDADLRYMLAMEHVSQGDDTGAVRCFTDLIRIAADYPAAYHQAGRALQRLGRLDEARTMLQRGIASAQKKDDIHAAGEMSELLAQLSE
jgi:tetratricopeptide (TPR) repeat protein